MKQLNIKVTQEQYDWLWVCHSNWRQSMGQIIRELIDIEMGTLPRKKETNPKTMSDLSKESIKK